MLGLPLVPCHEFPAKAPAAFFSAHALKDPHFATKLATFILAGKPVLLGDANAADHDPLSAMIQPQLQVGIAPHTAPGLDRLRGFLQQAKQGFDIRSRPIS